MIDILTQADVGSMCAFARRTFLCILLTVSNGEDTASLLQVGSGGGAKDPLLQDGGDLAQGSLQNKMRVINKETDRVRCASYLFLILTLDFCWVAEALNCLAATAMVGAWVRDSKSIHLLL